MTWNFNMDAAPKDQPVLAWCDNQLCECARERGCLYHAHADGLSHVDDGPHVVEWGGSFTDTGEYGEILSEMPDWWFRWDSEWEVAANPIAWQLIEPVTTKQIHLLAFDDTDRAECSGDDNEPCTSSFALVTCVDCKSALDDRGLLPDPAPAPVPHMPWLTDEDVP